MAKSYFAILGVTASASPDEIGRLTAASPKNSIPIAIQEEADLFSRSRKPIRFSGTCTRRSEYEQIPAQSLSKKGHTAHRPYPEPEPLIPRQQPVDMGEISPIRSFQTFTPSLMRSSTGCGTILPASTGPSQVACKILPLKSHSPKTRRCAEATPG